MYIQHTAGVTYEVHRFPFPLALKAWPLVMQQYFSSKYLNSGFMGLSTPLFLAPAMVLESLIQNSEKTTSLWRSSFTLKASNEDFSPHLKLIR